MQLEHSEAADQIERLSCLPYFAQLSPAAIEELIAVLVGVDDRHGIAAVTNIITDVARASSPATNRVPSPGELRAWIEPMIELERAAWAPPEPPKDPTWCLRCSGTGEVGRHGWKSKFQWGTDEWMADWKSSFFPCPDCRDGIEPDPEVKPEPVVNGCCGGGLAKVNGKIEWCNCALGYALKMKNRRSA